jgi:hypothetical protein
MQSDPTENEVTLVELECVGSESLSSLVVMEVGSIAVKKDIPVKLLKTNSAVLSEDKMAIVTSFVQCGEDSTRFNVHRKNEEVLLEDILLTLDNSVLTVTKKSIIVPDEILHELISMLNKDVVVEPEALTSKSGRRITRPIRF